MEIMGRIDMKNKFLCSIKYPGMMTNWRISLGAFQPAGSEEHMRIKYRKRNDLNFQYLSKNRYRISSGELTKIHLRY